jgi:phosphoribosylaminoimidazole-succinocarboxamide synthase
MAKIPEKLVLQFVPQKLMPFLLGQGKVRDRYFIPFYGDLLMVATDRLSAFDFVQSTAVPKKGEVLTALSHFWSTHVLRVSDDLIASRNSSRRNAVVDLNDLPKELRYRSTVVRVAEVMPFEFIYRGHIGGSVYPSYLKTGLVAGVATEPNLPKWSKLPSAAFTPSTKAENGHDVNITVAEFLEQAGKHGPIAYQITRHVYETAYAFAESRGILILDTKEEVGILPTGEVILVDEKLTPDSSRFTTLEDWKLAMEEKRDPQFFDKEPVRIYLKTVATPFIGKDGQPIIGIHKLDPENPEHVAFVHNLEIPVAVIEDAAHRNLKIFEMLTGGTLEQYQADNF